MLLNVIGLSVYFQSSPLFITWRLPSLKFISMRIIICGGKTLEDTIKAMDNVPGMMTEFSNALGSFTPVSYTHLDVYKRQPVQGTQARQAVRLADAALQRLGAQVNPKVC